MPRVQSRDRALLFAEGQADTHYGVTSARSKSVRVRQELHSATIVNLFLIIRRMIGECKEPPDLES